MHACCLDLLYASLPTAGKCGLEWEFDHFHLISPKEFRYRVGIRKVGNLTIIMVLYTEIVKSPINTHANRGRYRDLIYMKHESKSCMGAIIWILVSEF